MRNEEPHKVLQFPNANRKHKRTKPVSDKQATQLEDELTSAHIDMIDAVLRREATRLKALPFEDAEIVLAELNLALLRAERVAELRDN